MNSNAWMTRARIGSRITDHGCAGALAMAGTTTVLILAFGDLGKYNFSAMKQQGEAR